MPLLDDHGIGNTPLKRSTAATARPAAWLLALTMMLALLLAGVAHGAPAGHWHVVSHPAIAETPAPAHGPCGSQEGAADHHALCGPSASCSLCAPAEDAATATAGGPPNMVARSDPAMGGRESTPPFHPPKRLVRA
jgi:hypothetical protein